MALKRVLLVEDDESIRTLAAESLRDEGFEVVEAADGDAAAQRLDHPNHFDVLLTDVRMPSRLDGLDLVAYARERDPNIGVIVVSGYAPQLKERLQVMDPPVVFFSKPYRSREIISAISGLLS